MDQKKNNDPSDQKPSLKEIIAHKSVKFFDRGLPFQKTNSVDLIDPRFVTASKIITALRSQVLQGGTTIDDQFEKHNAEFIAHPNGLTIYSNSEEFRGFANIELDKLSKLGRHRDFCIDLYATQTSRTPYFSMSNISSLEISHVLHQAAFENRAADPRVFGTKAAPTLDYESIYQDEAYYVEAQRWNALSKDHRQAVIAKTRWPSENLDLALERTWHALPSTLHPELTEAMYLYLPEIDGRPLSYFAKQAGTSNYVSSSGKLNEDLAMAKRWAATLPRTQMNEKLEGQLSRFGNVRLVADFDAMEDYIANDHNKEDALRKLNINVMDLNEAHLAEDDYFDLLDAICKSGFDKSATQMGINPEVVYQHFVSGKTVWQCLNSVNPVNEDKWVENTGDKVMQRIKSLGDDLADELSSQQAPSPTA